MEIQIKMIICNKQCFLYEDENPTIILIQAIDEMDTAYNVDIIKPAKGLSMIINQEHSLIIKKFYRGRD